MRDYTASLKHNPSSLLFGENEPNLPLHNCLLHQCMRQVDKGKSSTPKQKRHKKTHWIFSATNGTRHGRPATSGGRLGSKVFTLKNKNSGLTGRQHKTHVSLSYVAHSVSLQSRHLAERIQRVFQTAGGLTAAEFPLSMLDLCTPTSTRYPRPAPAQTLDTQTTHLAVVVLPAHRPLLNRNLLEISYFTETGPNCNVVTSNTFLYNK